jgi:predicted exporter
VTVHGSPLVSKNDAVIIDRFQSTLQEKQDELAGDNGYVQVSDDQLNGFADYAVQDIEQAEVITISLVTLLLIILLVVLIVK